MKGVNQAGRSDETVRETWEKMEGERKYTITRRERIVGAV